MSFICQDDCSSCSNAADCSTAQNVSAQTTVQTQRTNLAAGIKPNLSFALSQSADENLLVGKYKLYFNLSAVDMLTQLPAIQSAMFAAIGQQINVFGKQFNVYYVDFFPDEYQSGVVVYIEVTINPFPVAWVIIGLLGIIGLYLVLDKIEKVVELSPGLLLSTAIIIVIVAVYFPKLFSKWK